MLQRAVLRERVDTELKWNLLVRPRALPDRHGELDRFKVEEQGRQAVGRQVRHRSRRVVIDGLFQRVLLHDQLLLVQQLVRDVSQVVDLLLFQVTLLLRIRRQKGREQYPQSLSPESYLLTPLHPN